MSEQRKVWSVSLDGITLADVKRVKLGPLDLSGGTARQGACPEGDVLVDGEYVGSWSPDTVDAVVCSLSHEQRVTGYSTRFDFRDCDVMLDVELKKDGPHPAKAKAALRRRIAAAVKIAESCRDCGERVEGLAAKTGLGRCDGCLRAAAEAHDAESADPDELLPEQESPTEFTRRVVGSLPPRRSYAPGARSNAAITRRNGGVRHQFLGSIGGCSANYR